MRSVFFSVLFLFPASFVIAQTGLHGSATETFEIRADSVRNLIPFQRVNGQSPPEPGKAAVTRGVGGILFSKAIQGIQKMIDDRQKKYSSMYTFSLKDEKFYNDISADGPFDPTGIRFSGFTVTRCYKDVDRIDTAFTAHFVVDTRSTGAFQEILNNGIFRLTLESFQIKEARVAMADNAKKLNMDFEISFVASFINNGEIHTGIQTGKFIYLLRDAPLDPADPGYAAYYNNLKNKPCAGQSFLIPRSAGYYKSAEGALEKCWGEGFYTINVSVKETSRKNFVDKLINFGADDAISLGSDALRKKNAFLR